MARDPLNRVVSPLGDRLQKQKDAITRFENRERIITNALAMYAEGEWHPHQVCEVVRSVLEGQWDNPALSS